MLSCMYHEFVLHWSWIKCHGQLTFKNSYFANHSFLMIFSCFITFNRSEKKRIYVCKAYETIIKYHLQIPVIMELHIFKQNIIASSLKITLIYLRTVFHTRLYICNLLLIVSSLQTDMRITAYFKFLLLILVMSWCLECICTRKSPCSLVLQVHKINVIA